MAFFTLTETSEVDMVWFLGYRDYDLLAVVYRDTDESAWRAVVRSRVYEDKKAFDSNDRKLGYEIKGPDGSAATVANLNHGIELMLADVMQAFPGGHLTRLEVHGDAKDFMRLCKDLPFMHMQAEGQTQ